MEYIVGFSISGSYYVTVNASNIEEAEKFAIKKWENADFGELKEIDAHLECIASEQVVSE